MASGSVIKGSGILIVARVMSMIGSFLLFLMLTWRSKEMAGIFRTSITFFIIMDTLPLLGMQRWLATEIARQVEQRYAIFRMAIWFAIAISIISTAAYVGLAYAGVYGVSISACLNVIALTTVPSAINLCVISALVGLGCSHQSGYITLAETVGRSGLSIILVLMGAGVVWVVSIFAIIRYITAGAGLVLVRAHLSRTQPLIGRALIADFFSQVPNLSVSMIAFLALRNAAMLLIPWLGTEAEAGIYAAPFQIFDLLLVVPTVLTISTNHTFVESAKRSDSSLRRSIHELLSITTLYVFPVVAIACVLARPTIELLFGVAFDASVLPFQILLMCVIVFSLDLVFGLTMITVGDYRSDRRCIVGGALVAVALSLILVRTWGPPGAALGFLAGGICTLGARLYFLRGTLRLRPLGRSLRGQAVAALAAALATWAAVLSIGASDPAQRKAEILLAPLGTAIYLAVLYFGGGLSRRRLGRMQTFMLQRS